MPRLLHISFLLLLSITTFAQRMPVGVTTILTQPYTPSLSAMAESGSTRLMVNLMINDLTISNLPAKLHIKLESNGITIESKAMQNVSPLLLNGGETTTLMGDDIAPYLRLDNLDFKGFTKQAYQKTGQLPSGLWKISVSVRHFHTNRTLSNVGTATAWLTTYKPPLLTLPDNNATAPSNAAQPLTFSWQASRHAGGTSAIMYRFELWEQRAEGVPAQTVAASVPPLYTTETSGQIVTVVPATLALEPGMRYCWRVTAFDPANMCTFENRGESEVRTFQYLEKCPEVSDLTVTLDDACGQATWNLHPKHEGGYNVELYNDDGTYHETLWGGTNKTAYIGGEYGKTWHIRVQGICHGNVESQWTKWVDFTTLDAPKPITDNHGKKYECGEFPPYRTITNFTLRETLEKGDTLENERGSTKFIVYSATKNDDGSFRGLSYMKLSIWGVNVLGEYDHMRVNTDGVIVGRFSWHSVKSDKLLATPDSIEQWANELAVSIASASYNNTIRDTVVVDSCITFATIIREDSRYYAVSADGQKEEITSFINRQNRILVQDAEGHQLVIDKDGEPMGVAEYKECGSSKTLLRESIKNKDAQMSKTGNVKFFGTDDYLFDTYDTYANHSAAEGYAKHFPAIGQTNYRPAYACAESRSNVQLRAEPYENITFKNERGVPVICNDGTLTIKTLTDRDTTSIYAYDNNNKIVGKVNILSYDRITRKLCLVPIGNSQMPKAEAVKQELDRIFVQQLVDFEVIIANPIDINYKNGMCFTHGGSGVVGVYNTDQEAAINKLKEQGVDNETIYLFMVSEAATLNETDNRTVVSGYMPRGYQFGFIYNELTNARTIAHELCHGAFHLRHTFDAADFIAQEGTTDNLMDYNHGKQLNHWQWKDMHKPKNVRFKWLQEESEGEMIAKADKDSISVKITNLSNNFAPNVNKLEIEYSLAKSTQRVMAKYPNEDFNIILTIADKRDSVLYVTNQKAKDKGTIIWNGLKDNRKERPIEFDEGPFKIKVILACGKEKILDKKFIKTLLNTIDFVYQTIKGDSVMFISTSADTLFNILNDPIKLDYLAYKDVFIKSKTEQWYLDFIESCKANGFFTDSTSKPMEWLINKGVTKTSACFCGHTISNILPELADMITKADKYLKEKHPNLHKKLTDERKYKPGPYTGISMRTVGSNKNSPPSLHSFGAAVDFDPTFNPYITGTNATIIKFIKYLTGFDIKKEKEAADSYNASKLFLEKLHGKNWIFDDKSHNVVIADYNEIDKYNGTSIDSLSNILNNDIVILDYKNNKIKIIEHLKKYPRRIVFEEEAIEGLNVLLDHLQSVDSDTIPHLLDERVNQFFSEYKKFKNEFQDLTKLVCSLDKKFSSVSENRILQHGFCSVSPEVYEAFNHAHKEISKSIMGEELTVDAGIKYMYSLDAMHFGLNKKLVQYLTNKK